MLKDLRNTFLGRTAGVDCFRTWPLSGEPLRALFIHEAKGCLGRGGPINVTAGLAKGILRSCGGDSTKHSPRVKVVDGFAPPPNLNGGNWVSGLLALNCTMFIECALVRAKLGLGNGGFLRLRVIGETSASCLVWVGRQRTRATNCLWWRDPTVEPSSPQREGGSSRRCRWVRGVRQTQVARPSGRRPSTVACVGGETCPWNRWRGRGKTKAREAWSWLLHGR